MSSGRWRRRSTARNAFRPSSTSRWASSACSASACRRRWVARASIRVTYALVMEELSRGYASVADQCGLVELVSTLLVRHGTPAQRERWLAGRPARRSQGRLLHHRAGGRHRCFGHPHDRGARRRRLAAQRRQDLDPQRAGRRCRLRAGPHRQGRRQSRHEHLHRRSARPRASSADRRNTRWASAPARSARCTFTDVGCRPTRCWARRAAAST